MFASEDDLMPINATSEQMTRLSLVGYLLRDAQEKATRPPPLCSLSLLSMHDAIEMFLDVAAEAVSAPISKRRDFKEYWQVFSNLDPPISLPMQRSMEKLNMARVGLKHHGHRTTADQINNHLIAAKSFLDEATNLCFGVSLSEISLVELIKSDKVRALLSASTTAMQNSNYAEALENAALAFAIGSARVYRRLHLSFMGFGSSLTSLAYGMDAELAGAIEHATVPIKEAINRLAEDYGRAISLVSLGVDLRDYELFQSLTPVVHLFPGGSHHAAQWMHESTQEEVKAQWCVDFVIDFMLRLESREEQPASIRHPS
jgi:hypothetical protein